MGYEGDEREKDEEETMKIAIDFDNTTVDSIQVWHNILLNTFPEKSPVPPISSLKDWNLAAAWGLTEEEKSVIFNIFRHKAIKYASPCDNNFAHWLRRLREDGHEVYILTANPESMAQNIRYWFQEFGVTIPVVFTKTLEAKLAYDFDILVDDANAVIDAWFPALEKKLLIYNNPWNEHYENTENIARVYNWEGIYNAVKNHE